jgi:putative transposase
MTAKAKPKQDEQGRWIKNGAAAKSGLNKSILASTWGQTKTYLQYKARRQGKLVIEVPPFYSSQECAACGHIHQDNRLSQSEFVCLSCGNSDHADHNAAKVIAMGAFGNYCLGSVFRKKRNGAGSQGSR